MTFKFWRYEVILRRARPFKVDQNKLGEIIWQSKFGKYIEYPNGMIVWIR